MGASVSSTQTTNDIANQFVANISTEVLTKNSTTATGSQSIKIACTDAAFAAATAACSADTASRNATITAIAAANPNSNILKDLISSKPDSCYLCSAENISMDMNVAIDVKTINDNTIANKIQAELSAKLKDAVENKTIGGIGLTDSQVDSYNKIQNYVENNFNTKIVNETINTYTFSQSLDATNQRVSNINMKMVGTALGSAIVSNAIKNDASIKAAIDAAVTTKSDTEGTSLNLFGGLGTYILIFIGIIIFGVIATSLGGGSPQYIQMEPQYMQQPMQMTQPMQMQIPQMQQPMQMQLPQM